MTDDARLKRALMSSATVAMIERARTVLLSAVTRSRSAESVRQYREAWIAAPWPRRRLVSGIVLLVAAVVHVVLVRAAGDPAGWFWLIVPALAASVGVLAIVMGAERSNHR